MKLILLLVIVVLNLASAHDIKYLDMSFHGGICFANDSKVKCFGFGSYIPEQTVEGYSNIQSLKLGATHACLIDALGVWCWGSNLSDESTTFPYVEDAKAIVTGFTYTCAQLKSDLHCWGRDVPLYTVIKFQDPKKISAAYDYVCAIDNGQVACHWVTENYQDLGQTRPPLLKNPTSLMTAWGFACATDDEGLKCWGKVDKLFTPPTIPAAIKRPQEIAYIDNFFGRQEVCALEDGQLICWGGNYNHFKPQVKLVNPRMLRGNVYGFCILDDEAVKCWDGDDRKTTLHNF